MSDAQIMGHGRDRWRCNNFLAGLNLAATLREPGEQGVSGIAAIDLTPFSASTRWLARAGGCAANRRVA